MPKFSIIIPCFNAAKTLNETLDSIRSQTFSSWEVICVDDGSTDETCAIIDAAHAADPRIILAHNPNKGPSAARNFGVKTQARGDIIAFCDADDLWSPRKLAQLGVAFNDLFTDAVFGKIAFFQEDPDTASVFSTVPDTLLSITMLLGENPVCTMSNIAIRRVLFLRFGGFDARIVHNEDLEWLIRLVGQGARIIGLDTCQTWYRASPYGLSADLKAMNLGRAAALETAARFGYIPSPASNAIYLRYLARRSLRLGQGRTSALRFVLRGLLTSPAGFFADRRRGLLTLAGSLGALVLPTPISISLFSR